MKSIQWIGVHGLVQVRPLEDVEEILPGRNQWILPGRNQWILPGRNQWILPGRNQWILPGRNQWILPGRNQWILPGRNQWKPSSPRPRLWNFAGPPPPRPCWWTSCHKGLEWEGQPSWKIHPWQLKGIA